MAQGEQGQHVALARAEAVGGGPFVLGLPLFPVALHDDELGRVRAQKQPASRHCSDRPHQVLNGPGLLDEAVRARLERVEQLLLLRQSRDDQHFGTDVERDDPARGREPSLPRHRQIHQDDIRPGRLGADHGFVPRPRLTDHDEIGLVLEQRPQAGAEDDVVVHEQEPDSVPQVAGGVGVEVDHRRSW